MKRYNSTYIRFIDDKNIIAPNKMKRNAFYLIKDYTYVDGERGRFSDTTAPIIYTIFVSIPKDVVHCIKVSNVRLDIIKKLFGKMLNEERDELILKGKAKAFYETQLKRFTSITSDAYRTYKLSGIKKVLSLDIDLESVTPKKPRVIKKVEKIEPKPKIQKVPPKPKVQKVPPKKSKK